jgi:hypothetical protein
MPQRPRQTDDADILTSTHHMHSEALHLTASCDGLLADMMGQIICFASFSVSMGYSFHIYLGDNCCNNAA